MARFRLIVAWALFAGWVSWLGWQSATRGRFPVVSRLQFLAADVAVVAEVSKESSGRPKEVVKVIAVMWPDESNSSLVGRELMLANLAGCNGFSEAGRYVLPLSGKGDGPYRIAELPRTPLGDGGHKPFVYPDVEIVREQVRRMPRR